MLLDTQNLFSDNQKITTGITESDNVVYFGKGDVSFVPLIIQVVEEFSGIESLSVQIQTDSILEFDNPMTLCSSVLTSDELKEGARFPISYLPKGNKGYMKLVYTATAKTGSADEVKGAITAGVVASDEQNSI